jgi:glyoxylate/hydroxypyruvate reductase A
MMLVGVDSQEPGPWIDALAAALPEAIVGYADELDRRRIEYVVGWRFPHGALGDLVALRGVLLTGAGYDHLDLDRMPPVPIVRLVDPAMADGIAAYCVSWIIHFTRDFDRYREHQVRREWAGDLPQRFPRDVTVGVLGAGAIGSVVVERCRAWGYRTVAVRHRDRARLAELIAGCEIVVSVLPATSDTRHLIASAELDALGTGVLINVGRGSTVDTQALLVALDGQLRAAVLDVFDQEPLPAESPLWSHPKVIVTPHIAGRTDPVTAAPVIAASIRQIAAGERPSGLVVRPSTRRSGGDDSNM